MQNIILSKRLYHQIQIFNSNFISINIKKNNLKVRIAFRNLYFIILKHSDCNQFQSRIYFHIIHTIYHSCITSDMHQCYKGINDVARNVRKLNCFYVLIPTIISDFFHRLISSMYECHLLSINVYGRIQWFYRFD